MFDLKIDLSSVESAARLMRASADQIPYVMAGVLNDAAFATRGVLVRETWPQHVKQRNVNFPSAVIRVEKASKGSLTVAIKEIRESSAPLLMHERGGVKVAKKRFAIPMPWYREGKQTSRGIRRDARARALIERTPKRALRVTNKGIFVGEHGKLRLAFVFKPTVKVPGDVPFYADFERSMRYALNELFVPRMEQAMRTRR